MDSELWPIGEVVRATGLTSRTLRHFDAIGLLVPSATKKLIRYYSQPDLLKLQSILLYRQLGFALKDIPSLLEDTDGLQERFNKQKHLLEQEISRLQQMLDALELSKSKFENGEPLLIDETFDGFNNDPYAEEAQERWPNQYAESQKRMAKLSPAQQAEVLKEHEQIAEQLGELVTAGAEASDPRAQALVESHYAWICNFWTPSREAYLGLGRMYVEDERFRKNYDKHANGTAQFLCDAIAVSQIPAN